MSMPNDATAMHHPQFSPGLRTDRAVLAISGAEATHFLHNLLTADVEDLQPGETRYAALLTPQGKILFDFFLLSQAEDFLLDCAESQKAELIKRLGFYKLRAKVSITVRADCRVIVAPDSPEVANGYVDPRLSAIGWRAIVPMGGLQAGSGYDRARIRLGLADSQADLGSGEFYPQEANLDLLGAVSFDKGCYIGQEVVSRMQHRGSARSRILPVRLEATAPEKGSEVLSGGRNVGALLSSQG